jgi:hypothetical protein
VPARPFPCLTNLNQAGQLYGGIIYHKAPIMMRQLELILGEEGLREGLGEYLKRFIYESLLSDEQRLALTSVDIIAGQLEDISNLDSRRRLEFIAPSLSADEAERDAFFDSLLHEENRRTERWVSDFLAQRPDYNPQLRMKILQAADVLFRAAAIRGAGLPPAQASARGISLSD